MHICGVCAAPQSSGVCTAAVAIIYFFCTFCAIRKKIPQNINKEMHAAVLRC